MASAPLSKVNVWKLASRPKTLPASAAPVIVGTGVAIYESHFALWPALAALACALLLQIGANIANDYFDYVKGVDTADRLGPVRVTQAGLATPTEVRTAMIIVFSLAALCGLYLVWVGGWPILVVGVLAIASAVLYTAGPWPLGYVGLGDLFAFIFFGPVAVMGTAYVQTGQVTPLAVWSSVPVGLLVVAILVVNNLRDIDTDRATGKHTLAVRYGIKFVRWEYVTCILIAFLIPPLIVIMQIAPASVLLYWFATLLSPRLIQTIFTQKGRLLNEALAGTGLLVLIYALLYSIGLVIGIIVGF